MSSSISAIISYLKPVLSEPDFKRLNHDLVLRDSTWKSEIDSISHRLASSEKHKLVIRKELEHSQKSEGELHLRVLDLEQKLTESNAELGSLREKLAQSVSADFLKLKRERDDYELNLAESKKVLEILKKQCLNWSKESRDLKGEIEKVGMQKETMSEMYEKMKQELEMEKTNRVVLEKKKKKVEDRSESIVKFATVIYKELELKMAKLEQAVAELSGPETDSSNNKGQQTNAQETIPCTQIASVTSPPFVELTDSDDDEEIKTRKRKLSFLETSENRSKQLKGLGKESVNASTPAPASQIGGTSFSVINEHEDAVQDDYSDEGWEYVADMLEALDNDIELRMKAVCALYQHSNVFSRPRDVALAKYLVKGDQEGRLKRSVVELEKFDQSAADDCTRIAFNNSTLLFGIYKSKACPFFAP